MRGLITLLLSLLCQIGMASTIVFDSEVHDFGSIKEVDGKVSHNFEFTNTGTQPIVVEDITVSCGCTTPIYSKQPVMPNQSKVIKITFDPEGRPGEFNKEIYITSGAGKNKNTLRIKGSVIPRPKTAKDDYPVELTSGVRLSTINLSFMYVSPGARTSMSVGVRNFSNKTATFKAVSTTSYVEVSAPMTLKANESQELTVSYNLPKGFDYGTLSNSVELYVNGRKQIFFLNLSAICVDNFVSLEGKTAKGSFSSQFLSLGNVKLGESSSREISLSNKGEADLIVRKVELPKDISTTLKQNQVIKPGQSIKLTINYSPSEAERYKESVIVILNDPLRPMRELRIFAQTTE